MADKNDSQRPPQMANDGHQPLQKGWVPKVQGGFKPTSNTAAPNPPKGNTGVQPPPPPPKK